MGLEDAGVDPGEVHFEHRGDGFMVTFPVGVNISAVLARMPKRLKDELDAFSRDRAPQAPHMRVRLAFTLGPSASGVTGRLGQAPVDAARLCGAPALREAMAAQPSACLGMAIENCLYHKYVRQGFRPDCESDEYASVRVSIPGKDFDAGAYIRLVGYPAATLLEQGKAATTSTLRISGMITVTVMVALGIYLAVGGAGAGRPRSSGPDPSVTSTPAGTGTEPSASGRPTSKTDLSSTSDWATPGPTICTATGSSK